MLELILDDAKQLQEQIVAWRRDIHQHPELGFEEHRTAALAADEMQRLGISVRRNVGRTGVVGDIDLPGSTHRILLRADMDALPVQEASGEPFASVVDGKSHLCGHDAHVAMLMGAARLLAKHRDKLKSSVRLMFQPSEEAGPGGALAMIDDGVLDGVDAAFAIHVFTACQAGKWGLRAGPVMAAVDSLKIQIVGRGGHAATPEVCIDPIVAAAQAITSLQTIMSRRIRPLDAGVLSLCTIHGGDAFNVIPEAVTILGTLRSHSEAMRNQAKKLMREILQGVETSTGTRIDLTINDSYPVLVNDAATIERTRQLVGRLFGAEQAIDVDKKFGGEDFSYIAQQVPAAMAYLGVGNAQAGITAAHHNPGFRIDESVLWQGTALAAQMALEHGQ